MIMINVDLLQKDSDVKFKCLHKDEININDIIDLLIQTSMLEKKKHSWKEVILKLIQRLQNISEKKIENQDAFITKNV